ncbi:hypothetical protein [Candidatus Paracaedibacter symbiosus]|uniref:hypothetical protein n=1 Tax=Candidatus Paracaedibacter symbiosus TaxID=244582 RepID=UPI000509D92C|nr:hypothetical protein [Candidatus Paracaedibacter symbiosus]
MLKALFLGLAIGTMSMISVSANETTNPMGPMSSANDMQPNMGDTPIENRAMPAEQEYMIEHESNDDNAAMSIPGNDDMNSAMNNDMANNGVDPEISQMPNPGN